MRKKRERMRKKAIQILKYRNALKSKGFDLIKALQSEITHELSSPCFQNNQSISPGDFTLEWDAPHSKDVVLRKKCDTSEEIAISANLPDNFTDSNLRPIDMKVCIKKPGLSSFLQFDCTVWGDNPPPHFLINSARYLPSSSSTGYRYYTGPLFSDLDENLQDAFKEYLKAKGVGVMLMNFVVQHMNKKEETQYLNWLQKLHEMMSPSKSNQAAESSKKTVSSQGY